MWKPWSAATIAAALSVLAPIVHAQDFELKRLSVASAAGNAASSRFATTLTLGGEGLPGIASSCNVGPAQVTGFYPLVDLPPVGRVLQVDRLVDDPEGVRLLWSGAAPQSAVHRSVDPSDVRDLGRQLQVVSACDYDDPLPPLAPITFYLILDP